RAARPAAREHRGRPGRGAEHPAPPHRPELQRPGRGLEPEQDHRATALRHQTPRCRMSTQISYTDSCVRGNEKGRKTMTHIEAVYEGGVFRPVEAVQLPEKQRVRLSIQPIAAEDPQSWWQRVRKRR